MSSRCGRCERDSQNSECAEFHAPILLFRFQCFTDLATDSGVGEETGAWSVELAEQKGMGEGGGVVERVKEREKHLRSRGIKVYHN